MNDSLTTLSLAQFGHAVHGGLGGVRLRLVLGAASRDGSGMGSPGQFVRLAGMGVGDTAFLGALSGACGGERPVAVVMVQGRGVGGEPQTKTDNLAGSRFRELIEEVRELTREAPPVVRWLDLGGHGQADRVLPPLWYCTKRQLLFVPPCPQCGAPLAECCDEVLLDQFGLVPAEGRPERYLHCPGCADEDTPPQLFQEVVPPGSHPVVGDASAILSGFCRLVHAAPETGNPSFPCQGCSFNHECYSIGGDGPAVKAAAELLMSLNFYGGPFYLMEFLPLHFGELCDLLGGRPGPEVRGAVLGRLGVGGDDADLVWPADWCTDLLFAGDAEDRVALEVLFLKLFVFEQLCRAVEAVHRILCRPHLDLRPQTIWAALSGNDAAVPSLWGMRVGLAGLGSARPVEHENDPSPCFEPPERFDLVYSHPSVASGFRDGEWVPARIRVASVDPCAGADSGVCTVSGELGWQQIPTGVLGAEGTVSVRLAKGLGFRTEVFLTCRRTSGNGGKFWFHSDPVELDPSDRERLASLEALPSIEVSCAVPRRFDVGCDLFSLGVLLFRALLVNGKQSEGAVSRHCRLVGDDLALGAAMDNSDTAAEGVLLRLGQRLTEDPLLACCNLLYTVPDASHWSVPNELWQRSIATGFRLITRIPGFSYGPPESGHGADADSGVLEQVVQDVSELRAAVRRALLAWQPPPEQEIRSVLQDLIDDPGWLDAVLGGRTVITMPDSDAPPAPGAAVASVEDAQGPLSSESGALDETVILRPGVSKSAGAATASLPCGIDESDTKEREAGGSFEETMILKSPGAVAPTRGGKRDGIIPGTPIPGDSPGPVSSDAASEPTAEADFESTVILTRKGKTPDTLEQRQPATGGTESIGTETQNGVESPEEEADFEKTVILRPGQKRAEKDG